MFGRRPHFFSTRPVDIQLVVEKADAVFESRDDFVGSLGVVEIHAKLIRTLVGEILHLFSISPGNGEVTGVFHLDQNCSASIVVDSFLPLHSNRDPRLLQTTWESPQKRER